MWLSVQCIMNAIHKQHQVLWLELDLLNGKLVSLTWTSTGVDDKLSGVHTKAIGLARVAQIC